MAGCTAGRRYPLPERKKYKMNIGDWGIILYTVYTVYQHLVLGQSIQSVMIYCPILYTNYFFPIQDHIFTEGISAMSAAFHCSTSSTLLGC